MMESKRYSLLRFYKIAGVIGGSLYILHGIAFAYSHGTTPQNRGLPIFGIQQANALTAIVLLFCLCFWFSLFGLKKERTKNKGRQGCYVEFKDCTTQFYGIICFGNIAKCCD
jgi:hypothetical protein